MSLICVCENLFPYEFSEMLSTSQGHRLIMKRAFNLATQLLVGLMKIITSRGRCWVFSVIDCLAFEISHSHRLDFPPRSHIHL